MKKTFYSALAAAMTLCLTACTGLPTANKTGNLLGSSLAPGTNTGTLANAGNGILGGILNQLVGNTTQVNNIYGTWVYAQPKVMFESENVLAQIGSSVASSKIESTLQGQLTKMGFTAGKTTMTFNQDGSCSITTNNRTTPGTYTFDQKSGTMTITGALGMTHVTTYVSVMGNQMYMMFDSSKLLGLASSVSSQSSYTATLSSLLNSYSGLKLGWAMTKK